MATKRRKWTAEDERRIDAKLHTCTIAPALKRADLEQCQAGRLLRQASDMLTSRTVSTLDAQAVHTEAVRLICLACVCLSLSKRRRDDHLMKFIDAIMKGGKKKAAK